jgi:adenine/guanine phosphoribosyltransferase-like PRPP-binding protein
VDIRIDKLVVATFPFVSCLDFEIHRNDDYEESLFKKIDADTQTRIRTVLEATTIQLAEDCIVSWEIATTGESQEVNRSFAKMIIPNLTLTEENTQQVGTALLLDFHAFSLSSTVIDKLVDGLFNGASFKKIPVVVFFVRRCSWFAQSQVFEKLRQDSDWRTSVTVMDADGEFLKWTPGLTSAISAKTSLRPFLEKNPETIYRELIYKTNSYIGHFVLTSAHVRTHYDLRAFINRLNVWDEYLERFTKIVGQGERVLVLALGIEIKTMISIRDRLGRVADQSLDIEMPPPADPNPSRHIKHDWTQKYSRAIVITDIVCTGNTLAPWLARLVDTSDESRKIDILAVASLSNSVRHINGTIVTSLVQIRRKFYSPSACLLCDLDQPRVEVNAASDFENVDISQPTPFDFWEMATEAKAIVRTGRNISPDLPIYRVLSRPITRRYGHWLGNLTKKRFDTTWPSTRPDLICTVDDESGQDFVNVVAKALNVRRIKRISREKFAFLTPSGPLSPIFGPLFETGDKVLIVDDGMNSGRTMESLIRCCMRPKVELIGALVFDSRLLENEISRLSALMSNKEIIALYSWPEQSN